jgi:hypothetical protein
MSSVWSGVELEEVFAGSNEDEVGGAEVQQRRAMRSGLAANVLGTKHKHAPAAGRSGAGTCRDKRSSTTSLD